MLLHITNNLNGWFTFLLYSLNLSNRHARIKTIFATSFFLDAFMNAKHDIIKCTCDLPFNNFRGNEGLSIGQEFLMVVKQLLFASLSVPIHYRVSCRVIGLCNNIIILCYFGLMMTVPTLISALRLYCHHILKLTEPVYGRGQVIAGSCRIHWLNYY